MKERLTGAIILVALIVLLVPELLTGPIRRTTAAVRPGTGAEESQLRSYTINLGDDSRGATPFAEPPTPVAPSQAAPAPQSTAEAAPAPAPQRATQAPPSVAPAPAAPVSQPRVPHPAAAPSTAPSPAAKPGTAGPGWMVQLGSFASRENAERLAAQVRARGFPVGVSRASSGRRLYRVRVGPARDRATATQLQARLRAAGHGGSIVPR